MELDKLPDIVLYTILLELKIEDIISCRKTSNSFKNITDQIYFWVLKSNKDFGISQHVFGDPYSHTELKELKHFKYGLTPMQIYLQFLSRLKNKSIFESLNVEEIDRCLLNAGHNGDINFINVIYKKVKIPSWLKTSIIGQAAEQGHLQFIMNFSHWFSKIKKMDILKSAIIGANMNVIEYIISLMSKESFDVNEALAYATIHGNIDLVNYFISKGGELSHWTFFNTGSYGKVDFINYMLDVLCPKYNYNNMGYIDILNDILVGASSSGHLDIVKYLVEKGATEYLYAFIYSAASINNLETTRYIIDFLLPKLNFQVQLKDFKCLIELIIKYKSDGVIETLNHVINTLFPKFGILIQDIDFNSILISEYSIANKEASKYLMDIIRDNDNIIIFRDTFITSLYHMTKNIEDFKYVLVVMETKLHFELTESETLYLLIKSIRSKSNQTSTYLFEKNISTEIFFDKLKSANPSEKKILIDKIAPKLGITIPI